ncbi:pyridoxamine 5'-phosphate oxidase family protein [Streptomyces sp. NPDC050161]|uniref:pyridoxamine 5'-phosphate oxidase family protein n=1 Tax=Streptomyces sp. NPDC050161 TaxID=3365604 RepID=UPI003795A073
MTERSFYREGALRMQETLRTQRLADHIAGKYVTDHLDETAATMLRQADCFYLATADADGYPDCSYKGGLPGFVQVPHPRLLRFPSYDGNGMFRSLGNILDNPQVGMLFIDYDKPIKLRVNGTAQVSTDSRLLALFPEADAVVEVDVRQVFENCPRYLHDVRVGQHSAHVPRPHHAPPDPEWKLKDEYQGLVRLRNP